MALSESPESASRRRSSIPSGAERTQSEEDEIPDNASPAAKGSASKRRYSLPSAVATLNGDAKALNERLAVAQNELLNSPKSERKSGPLKEKCEALETAIMEIHETHATRPAIPNSA